MRILAIARNTFHESVRDKVLYVLLLFAAVTIFGSKALGWISIGQDIKIVKDVTLAATSIFGALIAIFVGAMLWIGPRRRINHILDDAIFSHQFLYGQKSELDKRLGAFADLIARTVRAAEVDEVLIVGHSLGAALLFSTTAVLAWQFGRWKRARRDDLQTTAGA